MPLPAQLFPNLVIGCPHAALRKKYKPRRAAPGTLPSRVRLLLPSAEICTLQVWQGYE